MGPRHPSDIDKQQTEENEDAIYVYSFININISPLYPY
jgi:hypothetical protein